MEKSKEYIVAWIKFAEADLKTAIKLFNDDGELHIIVFLSQQACEKIIKAVLLSHSISFRKTHDLHSLIALIEDQPFFSARLFDAIEIFEKFGVEIRYPDTDVMPNKIDAEIAVRNAEHIVEYFIKHLNEK